MNTAIMLSGIGQEHTGQEIIKGIRIENKAVELENGLILTDLLDGRFSAKVGGRELEFYSVDIYEIDEEEGEYIFIKHLGYCEQ